MKLATFDAGSGQHVGFVNDGEVVDLTAADPSMATMIELLERDPEKVRASSGSAPRVPLSEVKLCAPVPRPPKFLAIGYNYAAHLEETHMERPSRQAWFNKQQTCIIGPSDPVWIPTAAPDEVDYEGELGVVIGKQCKDVPNEKSAVLDVIAGFTIVDDVSVRDWQELEPGMVVSKSFDTHGPIGPWIVTPDEIGDPLDLRLHTYVSGDLRQDGHTADMLFDLYEQVSYLSSAFTLEVGDVLATGTPSGIAWHRPGKYLKAGDTVRIEIDKIGALENPVIDEPR
ncbi:fumarylacetoacetate hydrolase family protein [Streptomyces sp. AK02-01A]|uniref:fumarylacetoacetate hydrolase family protein n=1 Tax=Streptomyces sp. AK02-01A TaxID=3028648 RepID=UPI0029B3C83A|nr:fumarylacetoacetate hydrolase family protein [Streptomyces sp. AK02-01A]MDX3853088.1 fumarylacetoacetate hydrolase family protein [Streptomyces sp. AK02-01A]